MDLDFNEEVLKEFNEEGTELLDTAELSLIAVDKGEEYQPHFDAIYRAFHSIKGGAGMFGLEDLQKHVHHLENILEKTKGDKCFPRQVVDYLLRGVDATKEYLVGKTPCFALVDPMDGPTSAEAPHPRTVRTPPSSVTLPDNKEEETFRILLLDDEENQVRLLKALIEGEGFEVEGFTTGQDLIDRIIEHPVDTVITDLKMPEMDGIEVLKRVRKINTDLPVILLSGYLTKELCIEGLSFGAYAFLEKPVKVPELLNLLINATRKYRTMRLINRSLNFIMYQYSDLDELLQNQRKETMRTYLKNEIQTIIAQKKELRQLRFAS